MQTLYNTNHFSNASLQLFLVPLIAMELLFSTILQLFPPQPIFPVAPRDVLHSISCWPFPGVLNLNYLHSLTVTSLSRPLSQVLFSLHLSVQITLLIHRDHCIYLMRETVKYPIFWNANSWLLGGIWWAMLEYQRTLPFQQTSVPMCT